MRTRFERYRCAASLVLTLTPTLFAAAVHASDGPIYGAATLAGRAAWMPSNERLISLEGENESSYRSTIAAPHDGPWRATLIGRTRSRPAAEAQGLPPGDHTVNTQMTWEAGAVDLIAEAGYRLREGSQAYMARDTLLTSVGARYNVTRDVSMEAFADYRHPLTAGWLPETEFTLATSWWVAPRARLQFYGFRLQGEYPATGAGLNVVVRF